MAPGSSRKGNHGEIELLSASFGSQKANARSFRLSIRAKSARQQAACDHCTEAKQGLQRFPKLNPARWMMERSSTLGRSVQADPAWGQESYLRWRRPPAVGRPAQFHLECPGATEDSSAERADNSRHLREKYFCYG